MAYHVWLDDKVEPPKAIGGSTTWQWFHTAKETIDFLTKYAAHAPFQSPVRSYDYHIEEISLDHDLGDEKNGTGGDVLKWIEEKVMTDENYQSPFIFVHSQNVVALKWMEPLAEKINNMMALRLAKGPAKPIMHPAPAPQVIVQLNNQR